MPHLSHTIRHYRDNDGPGSNYVPYCAICSAEGQALEQECPKQYIDKNVNKPIDNKTEPA